MPKKENVSSDKGKNPDNHSEAVEVAIDSLSIFHAQFVTLINATVLPDAEGIILSANISARPYADALSPVSRWGMTWPHFERTYELFRRLMLRHAPDRIPELDKLAAERVNRNKTSEKQDGS